MTTYITPEMRASLNEDEIISLHLSKVLEALGYGRQMRQFRKEAYQEQDRHMSLKHPNKRIITSGSKGEGLTKPFESDHDILILDEHVVCTEKDLVELVEPGVSVFTFTPEYPYPGYNILSVCTAVPPIAETVDKAIVPTDIGCILSSDAYAKANADWHKTNPGPSKVRGRSGPATSHSYRAYEYDKVYSLPSVSPSILLEWFQRPRQHEWPPTELRDRIVHMNGNFVAKGFKSSINQSLEWRQCFNEAELLLVHSWCDMLNNLYVLLKIVLKEILKRFDKGEALTSYIMKNIVFWLAESNPYTSFQDKALLKWLMRALRTLRHALKTGYLPYYMIPGRNLLGDDIPDRVRDKLITCIKLLLREGPCLLLRCKKFKFTRFTTHEELYAFGSKRDDLEMSFLTSCKNFCSLTDHGLPVQETQRNEVCSSLYRRVSAIANTTWPPHIEEKLEECTDEWGRFETILK